MNANEIHKPEKYNIKRISCFILSVFQENLKIKQRKGNYIANILKLYYKKDTQREKREI